MRQFGKKAVRDRIAARRAECQRLIDARMAAAGRRVPVKPKRTFRSKPVEPGTVYVVLEPQTALGLGLLMREWRVPGVHSPAAFDPGAACIDAAAKGVVLPEIQEAYRAAVC